jgi:hypothetical protein
MSKESAPRCEKCGWVKWDCQCIKTVCPECGHWLTRKDISEGVLHCPGCEKEIVMAFCEICGQFEWESGAGYGSYCFDCGRKMRMTRRPRMRVFKTSPSRKSLRRSPWR